jgi:hypothetical protein
MARALRLNRASGSRSRIADPLGGAVTLALKGAEWLDWLSY